ncbi:hypothetical protein Tco_1132450 [Tanacetum coccineum]|uniref:Uncharacterized protein n=1 Tax=Tanacetum coccineum TaxID=301880 RepID=A0ABQ5JCJ1_9ASTR
MYLPPACYTLSKAEKTSFCECLHGVKVPSGYFANIKNLVSMKDLKLLGMKSYDCHVLLTQMIPIAIRGLMPPQVRQTITKLCLFFNMIHSKVIDHEKLDVSYCGRNKVEGSIVQGYAAKEVVHFVQTIWMMSLILAFHNLDIKVDLMGWGQLDAKMLRRPMTILNKHILEYCKT